MQHLLDNMLLQEGLELMLSARLRGLLGSQHRRKAITSEYTAEYASEKPPTPLLDTINFPIHMKNLSVKVCRYSRLC